jgi:erythromycin esterase
MSVTLIGLVAWIRPTPPAAPSPAAAEDGVTAWLVDHRVPLDTLDPAAPLDDLRPLGPLLGPRRVVAVGEVTHGTRELFLLRHRLFRFLVEEHGFTLLAMELPMSTGALLDDWVHERSDRDLREILDASYWFAPSAELVALLEWMRQRARADPRVEVFGFDVQRPGVSAAALDDWLEQHDPALRALAEPVLEAATAGRLSQLEDLDAAARAIEGVQAGLTDAADAARARHHAAIVAHEIAVLRYCARGENAGCRTAARDEGMAERLLERLDETGARALVWAHNGHVAHAVHPDGWRPMGHHLRQALGADELYVVATEFDRGGFVAPAGGVGQTARTLAHPRFELAEYRVDPAPQGTVAAALARVPSPGAAWFVDLGPSAADPAMTAFFASTRALHEYGGLPPATEVVTTEQLAVPEGWDGLVFVPETRGFRWLEPGAGP